MSGTGFSGFGIVVFLWLWLAGFCHVGGSQGVEHQAEVWFGDPHVGGEFVCVVCRPPSQGTVQQSVLRCRGEVIETMGCAR